jgi:hypothetical protein
MTKYSQTLFPEITNPGAVNSSTTGGKNDAGVKKASEGDILLVSFVCAATLLFLC